MNAQDQLAMVVDSLLLAAADPDEQLAAIPDFACPTDEVASTFGDAWLLVPQLVRAGLVSVRAAEALRALDDWLGQCPLSEAVSEASSLRHDAFWVEARHLARMALEALDVARRPPRLGQVTWVPGPQ